MTGSPGRSGPGPPRQRAPLLTATTAFGGRLLMLGGFILFVSGYVLADNIHSFVPHVVVLAGAAGFGLTLFANGVRSVRNARMEDAPTAHEVLAKDSRDPVLYLRSFKQDPASGRVGGLRTRSDEEQLSAVLRRIGPVVAVGDPSERRVTLGANRIYLRDDEWQGWVTSQMAAAALVIFRASDTDAFWWEVATAAMHVRVQKIAFLLPSDRRVYEAFRQRVAEHFPNPLPPNLPRPKSIRPPSGVWGLMYFNDAGQPVFRRWLGGANIFTLSGGIFLVGYLLGFHIGRPLEPPYLYLLRPLLKRSGAPTLLRPTLYGVFNLFTLIPIAVVFLLVGMVVRRLQGKTTVAVLPGWNESW